jgi:hypothetical protein
VESFIFQFSIKKFKDKNRTLILPECGREERGLRLFENRVLRRIFGPKRDVVRGKCRKLHNEELNL